MRYYIYIAMQLPKRPKELEAQQKKKLDPHLTPEAIERLKKELKDLEDRQLPALAAEMRRTGANGDFSENAEYQHAKHELRRVNSRIIMLKTKIRDAIPIPPEASQDGRISIGSTVHMRVNDKEIVYEIVGSDETNPAAGRISHQSPLGQALLHHKAGDIVTIETRDNRKIEYEIVAVK